MTFSLKLKELREQQKLSQRQLAAELGVGVGTVGMWESSERMPPAKRLKTIASFFNVSVDELLGNDIVAKNRIDGITETRKESITPLEEEMLFAFRAVGNKHGEKGQRALIDVAKGMA